MKSIKSKVFLRKPITHRRIKSLVKKALQNSIDVRPSKGKVFLKDIPIGSLFRTSGLKGILLDVSICSAKVVITEKYGNGNDDAFYLGKRLIAPQTEVEKL